MFSKLIVPSVLTALTLAALTGCFGSTEEQTPNNGARSTTSAQKAEAVCHVDAGCEGPPKIVSARVTLDGKACPIDIAYPSSALSLGLDGTGWTATFESPDCGFILNVSGIDNAPYPQTSLKDKLGISSVQLFTGEDPSGTDAGTDGTYLNDPDGSVTITSGPNEGFAGTVRGEAHVRSGARAHDVTFEMVF